MHYTTVWWTGEKPSWPEIVGYSIIISIGFGLVFVIFSLHLRLDLILHLTPHYSVYFLSGIFFLPTTVWRNWRRNCSTKLWPIVLHMKGWQVFSKNQSKPLVSWSLKLRWQSSVLHKGSDSRPGHKDHIPASHYIEPQSRRKGVRIRFYLQGVRQSRWELGASQTITLAVLHTSGEKKGLSPVRRKGGFQRENANPLSDRSGEQHSS